MSTTYLDVTFSGPKSSAFKNWIRSGKPGFSILRLWSSRKARSVFQREECGQFYPWRAPVANIKNCCTDIACRGPHFSIHAHRSLRPYSRWWCVLWNICLLHKRHALGHFNQQQMPQQKVKKIETQIPENKTFRRPNVTLSFTWSEATWMLCHGDCHCHVKRSA